MQEIKLNKEPVQQTQQVRPMGISRFPIWVKIIVIVILVAGAAFGVYKYGFNKTSSASGEGSVIDKSAYYSVFLGNGQVYFGQISEINQDQIVLTKVFYLQLADNKSVEALSNPGQPRLNLIKLGTELHGPTDTLYIYKQQVLFYEKLRDDSKVVQSIKQSNI